MKKHGFEKKAQMVKAGGSKIFKQWSELVPELTEEDFITALEWVCDDPRGGEERGKLTREIGLTKSGIVKLTRTGSWVTSFYRLDTKELWAGETFKAPCEKHTKDPARAKQMGLVDEDGMIELHAQISLSAEDRV